MRFDIITLFPELFAPFMTAGVTRRAFESGQVQVRLWQLRDFAEGQYRRVDDRPFGGGPGMVMLAEPLARCVEAIHANRADAQNAQTLVVLFSPAGRKFDHGMAEHWAAAGQGAILVCGRYEGIDQRFINAYVTHQISLGDFVLSGGEIAALALLDAVARLQPGVLHDAASSQLDSFNPALDGLLDSPHYTRPEAWRGASAPQALLSGHHAHIQRWRREQSLALTAAARPDLIAAARAAGRLNAQDEAYLRGLSGL
ncbi:MAG: tRNA (guanosine(37)-N1)-methyltransferase TrmD [Burkholderiaceae bacterium]|jgi:tRNA (guanine37-N1)-methyltransferase|nr:tRNA (guanosine(37)-N1)-methyltransferase TrmD [Burkholderiaceae bacterium]